MRAGEVSAWLQQSAHTHMVMRVMKVESVEASWVGSAMTGGNLRCNTSALYAQVDALC